MAQPTPKRPAQITAAKRMEEALRESEERFRLLVDGARDYAIFLLEPDNIISYWSIGAERIFGWTPEEAVGKSGKIIFTPADRKRKQEEKEIAIALRDGMASDRRWHIRKDGKRVWMDGFMHRLMDEETGALRGFAKIARDMTEQRRNEIALRKARSQLEKRVRQRTAELQEEIAARSRLETEISEISEKEKRRIGQDLHDTLCQELTAAAFLLESTAKRLKGRDMEESTMVSEAAQIVNANVGLARDLARGLHPVELGGGLPVALRELAFRTQGKVSCRFESSRGADVKDATAALNFYRIAQEAVSNALKHGKPTEIIISLRRCRGGTQMMIWDDGVGLHTKDPPSPGGMGINIMNYRANSVGANCKVEAKNQGTCVTCILLSKTSAAKTRARRSRLPRAQKIGEVVSPVQ